VVDTKLYDLLGLSPDCSQDAIKKAYRKLACKYHPDVNKSPDAVEKMREINAAHEVLKNPDMREKYDRSGMDNMDDSHDIFDVFRQFSAFGDMFGHGGGHHRSRQPRKSDFSIHVILKVSLKQVYGGGKEKIVYKRKKYCETCGSTGSKSRKEPQCGKCNGRGVVIRQTQMGMMIQQVQTACDHCGGSGKSAVKSSDKCATCAGKSFLVSEETIEQTIEPGVVTEQKAVHKNMGNQCLESKGIFGDLIVVFDVAEDHRFLRANNDLYFTMKIDYIEALFGFERIFTHLDDSKFVIAHKATERPIATDQIYTVWSQGLPMNSSRSKFGNLHIIFEVVTPSKPIAQAMPAEQLQALVSQLSRPSKQDAGNDFTNQHSKRITGDVHPDVQSMKLNFAGVVASLKHKTAFESRINSTVNKLNKQAQSNGHRYSNESDEEIDDEIYEEKNGEPKYTVKNGYEEHSESRQASRRAQQSSHDPFGGQATQCQTS